MENISVGSQSIAAMAVGAALAMLLPVGVALSWKFKKKEPMTSILIGAATFLLFAVVLEKPIQNVLVFPTQMGLSEHAVSRFLNANPVLWALVVGLFPGVFEETGRLVAFKTLLRKRKNRETSISHGIGHGCFEVMFLLGMTYIGYIIYAVMINTGSFGTLIDQAAAQIPDQVDTLYDLAGQLSVFSFADVGLGLIERVFAVLFHIGGSILVFYACKDKKKFWLYPLAILLHTAMDFIAALTLAKLFNPSTLGLEAIVAAFGLATFFGAYFLLYRKDQDKRA